MVENKKKPAAKKTKSAAEVPAVESKSKVEAAVVLKVGKSKLDGGNDPKPAKDSGDGAVDASTKAKRAVTTLWTS